MISIDNITQSQQSNIYYKDEKALQRINERPVRRLQSCKNINAGKKLGLAKSKFAFGMGLEQLRSSVMAERNDTEKAR
jgi:hypothetical protein